MEQAALATVQAVYGAFLQGDREAVRERLAPDVRWHNSGLPPVAGEIAGPDAVIDYVMGENHLEDFQLEVIDMLSSVERVAIVSRTSGRIGDVRIVHEYIQLMRVSDGRIAEVWNYTWDQQGLAAAFASARAAATA